MLQAVLLGATIVSTAALVVFGCLAIFAGLTRAPKVDQPALAEVQQDAVFIFRDQKLIDCSDRAQALLKALEEGSGGKSRRSDLAVLIDYLAPRFPGIKELLAELVHGAQIECEARGEQSLQLSARRQKSILHLRLRDSSEEGSLIALDRLSHEALQKELTTLRHVLRHMPSLVWQSDRDGRIIWANSAYLRALQEVEGQDLTLGWPLPALFVADDLGDQARLSLRKSDQTSWFAHSCFEAQEAITHFATPIDAAVQSEAARREALQTLTQTFACLPIGLALFDADRRLQVFNPALVDLTGLEPIFLAARPSLEQLLYSMREARMLPEPKDFNAWRRNILDLEQAAEQGDYSEEWMLDGGKTYLVTGRPQPNGAIALFLQDITSEAALTRSFRAEIETSQSALDALGVSIAVFGMTGQTLLTNAEYAKLWKVDPCADLADRGLAQALAGWSEACHPTTFWARLAEFVSTRDAARRLSGVAILKQGGKLEMTATRLPGGNTMLVFSQTEETGTLALPSQLEEVLAPRRDTKVSPEISRKLRGARHAGTRLRV